MCSIIEKKEATLFDLARDMSLKTQWNPWEADIVVCRTLWSSLPICLIGISEN